MNAIAQFVRTTIVGGLFFPALIVVLIVILAKAFDYAEKGLHAVVVHIPAVSELSVGVATTLSIAMIARLPSCWACRAHPGRAAPRQYLGGFGAV